MSKSANQSLVLSKEIYQQLLAAAEESYPNECVGLVFSNRDGLRTIALKNVAENPQVTYLAEPLELLQALKQADASGDDLVAIYHSHPQGPNHPSATDLAKAYYDVPALIILPKEKKLYGFVLKTLPRFVEPQTNRRAEASKNNSVQQGSTLRGIAINTKKEDDRSHPPDNSEYYEIELVVR